MKKLNFLIICIVFSLSIMGCSNEETYENYDIVYNSAIYDCFVDSSKTIYGDIQNKENNIVTVIQSKDDEKIQSFEKDPFFNDKKLTSHVKSIRIDNKNNKGYYMDTSGTEEEKGFSIIEFDLNTFNKKEIYKEKVILEKNTFLGLNKVSDIKVSKENDFSENKTSNLGKIHRQPKYFVNKNYIVFIKEDGIYKVNIKDKKQTVLIKEDGIKDISFDGESIYYINNKYEMFKYSMKTSKKDKITNNRSSYLMIAKGKIIYTNLNDKNSIYSMDKNGTNNIKIGRNKAKSLNYDDKYIYYSNDDDGQCLYRMKYDGSENVKMTQVPTYFIFTFSKYDKIYIWSDDDKTRTIRTFSVNKETFDVQLLIK